MKTLIERAQNEGHAAFVEMRLVLLLTGLQIDGEQQLASVRVQVDRQGDFVLAEVGLVFPEVFGKRGRSRLGKSVREI